MIGRKIAFLKSNNFRKDDCEIRSTAILNAHSTDERNSVDHSILTASHLTWTYDLSSPAFLLISQSTEGFEFANLKIDFR